MNETMTSGEVAGASPVEAGRSFLAEQRGHEISPMARQLAASLESPDGQMAFVSILRNVAERPEFRQQMKEMD